jgi:5-methylcytosine-specific restriction endonuclease McrA
MNVCKVCGKKYKFKHNNGTAEHCIKCFYLIYRLKMKKRCIDIKGGKCQECGYDKSLRALTFHHVNPEDKLFGISDNLCRKWQDTEKELAKCILLCMNCHAKLHLWEKEIK